MYKLIMDYKYNIIAHILTLIRILLTPVFAILIYHVKYHPELSIWLKAILLYVGISDWLDGYIAKKWGRISRLGAFFDPIADKIFLDTSIIVISITYNLSIWITAILIGRDVSVLIVWSFFVFVSRKRYVAVPHIFGKIMVAFQIVTIAAAAFSSNTFVIRLLCTCAAFFSLGSALIYILKIDIYRKQIS